MELFCRHRYNDHNRHVCQKVGRAQDLILGGDAADNPRKRNSECKLAVEIAKAPGVSIYQSLDCFNDYSSVTRTQCQTR